MPWKKIILIDFLLIALLILATRFATFLHEVFGHAFVALIMCGEVHSIKISLFGGGMVWAELGKTSGPALFLYCLAGIFVNLFTGVLPIVFGKKIRKMNVTWGLLWSVFAMTSLLGALAYLVLGIYYDFGDPVNWVQVPPQGFGLLWIPFLVITPFTAYSVSRLFIFVQENIFPPKDFVGRIKMLLATLGVSCLVYACLFVWTNQSLASVKSSSVDYYRKEALVIERKKAELAQKLQKTYPELTKAEIQARVGNTPIHVEPDEVPTRFPMIPVFLILCLLGGSMALPKKKSSRAGPPIQPGAATVLVVCFLAVIALATLTYTNGFIYKEECATRVYE
jgi:hypothetical protein